MSTSFQHRADGTIHLFGPQGEYAASLPQFADDLAALGITPYESLPDGALDRAYDGALHVLHDASGSLNGELPWDAGQQYLLHFSELFALQRRRDGMQSPNIFVHEPDGMICLRGAHGDYRVSPGQFAADLKALGISPYEGLPQGHRSRSFDGESHRLFTFDNQLDGGMPWPAGQQYLLHYAELFALQTEREKPQKTAMSKDEKRQAINIARLTANWTSFEFKGKSIGSNIAARADIESMAIYIALFDKLPPDFSGEWKALDNSYVAITSAATFKAMMAAMVAADAANFKRAQELKARLADASTPDQIAAIVW